MMFCSLRCERVAWTTSRAVHGSLGLAPTFRKSDPSGLSTRVAAATQVSVHSRYSDADKASW
jgi:hypothetical protein